MSNKIICNNCGQIQENDCKVLDHIYSYSNRWMQKENKIIKGDQ